MAVWTGTLAMIVLAAMLAAGLGLSLWGLRGRRVGDAPYCRRCGYNLTGISGHCPECGAQNASARALKGTRRRRWRMASVGMVLTIIAGAVLGAALYGRSGRVNWYAHLPDFALIWQARTNDPAAIKELVTRCGKGLDPATLRDLVPLALAQQGLTPWPRSIWAWTDFLAAMEAAGQLSTEQSRRFRDQIGRAEVTFRPRVREGEDLKIQVGHWTMGAAGVSGQYSLEAGELSLGPWKHKVGSLPGDSLSARGSGSWTSWSEDTNKFKPGVYDVTLRMTKVFENPSFIRPVWLTKRLEVLPADAPDTVREVDDPTLGAEIRKAITITARRVPLGGPSEPGKFYVDTVSSKPLPIGCAFELIARVGDREVVLGPVTNHSREVGGLSWQTGVARSLIAADVFVPVLRSSVRVAKEHTQLDEIWQGELVFDPIRVPPAEPNPTEPTSQDPDPPIPD